MDATPHDRRCAEQPADGAVKRRAATPPWPLAVACAANAVTLSVLAVLGMRMADGTFVYALDDAYIHMSLARNLVAHGVFGATMHEFASASSSPAWTLLIAGLFRVGGVQQWMPLVVTVLSSFGVLFVSDLVLRNAKVSGWARASALLWLVLAAPMSALVFSGMEHLLHAVATLGLVFFASLALAAERQDARRYTVFVSLLALLATGLRFESLALSAIIAVLAAIRGRRALGAGVVAAAGLPVVAYGLVSLANGGYFLPNPILIKSAESGGAGQLFADPVGYLGYLWRTIPDAYPVYLLMAVSVGLTLLQRREGRGLWRFQTLFPLLAIGGGIAHALFGDIGWFYRYEAYLMVLLSVGIAVQLNDVRLGWPEGLGRRLGAATLAVLILMSVCAGVTRGVLAAVRTPQAMENIYLQQYQMAMFFRHNPQITRVALGDLGAISFFNDGLWITDLEGLGESGVPLDSLMPSQLDAAEIEERTRKDGAQVAVVFQEYFDIPESWVPVQSWTIERAVASARPTVVFYAIPPTDAEQLEEALERFRAEHLPSKVSAKTLVSARGEDSAGQP